MKKILAVILTLIMTGSTAFAYSDVSDNSAVDILSKFEILEGFEDGTFKPEETVTRAQMAKIICEILSLNESSISTVAFTDVSSDHWANGYVNTISGLNIICGYGDGNYGPEDIVTLEQAVKMIVGALGYEPMAQSKGGYPTGYMTVANQLGLLKNVSSSNRGDIAVLVLNALETPVMEQTAYGSQDAYEPLDGTNGRAYKTLLTSNNIYKATGVVRDASNDKINFTITKDSKDKEFTKADSAQIFNIGASDIVDYKHQEVEVYVVKDDDGDYTVVSVRATAKTETFTIMSDDLKEVNGTKVTYYTSNDKTKTLSIDSTITIEYNKNDNIITDLADFIGKDDIQLTFVENDGDTKYDTVIAIEYISERLEFVDSYKNKMTLNGTSVKFDFDDEDKIYIFTDINGNKLTLDDFAEDDVVAWYCDKFNSHNIQTPASADYIEIIKLENSNVVGTIDTVTSYDKTVEINGTDYEVAKNIWNADKFSAGSEGIFYIGLTGKIVYYDDTKINVNYGYVLGAATEGTFDKDTVVKMLTVNGIKTYTVKSTVTINNNLAATGVYADGRLVEYSLNSKGVITSLKYISPVGFTSEEYNANTEILYDEFIDKNTLFFVLDKDEYDESYVTTMKYLVDGGSYDGYMYVKDKDVKVVVITKSNSIYNNEDGFAIVTGTSMVTKDGEVTFAVSYVQNSIANTIYFEDYDYATGSAIFSIGTVFIFNADSDDFVKTSDYKIIAAVENNRFITKTTTNIGKDVTVVTGYIDNEARKTSSKGELITVDNGKTYVITSTANKYTFNNSGSRDKIEIEDFLAGEAYYKDTAEGKATSVLIKLVDGVVVDIYTISERTDY